MDLIKEEKTLAPLKTVRNTWHSAMLYKTSEEARAAGYGLMYDDREGSVWGIRKEGNSWESIAFVPKEEHYEKYAAMATVKKSLNEKKVYELVDTAVNDVFLKCQNEAGIEDGGLDPFIVVDIDVCQLKLSQAIIKALDSQLSMNKRKSWDPAFSQLPITKEEWVNATGEPVSDDLTEDIVMEKWNQCNKEEGRYLIVTADFGIEYGMETHLYSATPVPYENLKKDKEAWLHESGYFLYQGFHFKPVARFKENADFFDITRCLALDFDLGMMETNFNGKQKHPYNHDAFYEAATNKEADIFYCFETQKEYVPCEHELQEYKRGKDLEEPLVEEQAAVRRGKRR